MEYYAILNEVYKLWWIIPFLLVVAIFKTPWLKGILGEAFVTFVAWLRLPKDKYYRFHNVMLPTPDGTTQIDHIFISRFGIFVVETKNMKGWIFGSENQAQWTQRIFRKSFKFQNPLRQNFKHVKVLEAALDVPPESIHSVVVFAGESTFKSPMPANVTAGGGYITYIKSFSDSVLSESQVQRALRQIESSRIAPTRKNNRQHAQNLKMRTDTLAERNCPKCGSSMVLREAKRGANTGNKFWGCSAYPKCRVVQNVATASNP